jgi:hypothetical protein
VSASHVQRERTGQAGPTGLAVKNAYLARTSRSRVALSARTVVRATLLTNPSCMLFAHLCARVTGAGNYSANTLSCEPCQIGEFCVAGTSVGVRCPLAQSTTNGRGARSDDDCVCQVGYYMDESGCVPCRAMGTNCTAVGVTVATLPLLADWWRLPNSTQLERCFAISNCTGGSDALQLCGEGYEVGS